MDHTVSSDHLVGRDAELRRLGDALGAALAGRPGLTLVAGTSGIGKTRLLGELATRAAADGVRVLRGECVALGDGELAYAPVTGALRPLARDGDPAFAALPDNLRRALARLLPDLGEEDPDAGRSRLFDALLALLRELAAPAGLLLILEDLHWADSVTRDLLRFLAAGLTDERILVAGSFRDDELGPDHPLRRLLSDVDHDRLALGPLTREELAELAAGIAAGVDDALVARLWDRAQGNPLFVEELLAVGGESLPDTLRETLLRRVATLSPDAHEVVTLLTIGGRVAHPLLADVAELDRPALRSALREAVASSLVVVEADDRYALRHALLREAVRSDLLPGEAADVHRRFAAALEAAGGAAPEDVVAIANHHAGTGDARAILRSGVAAGEAGRRRFAFEEAGRHFERALEAWDAAGDDAEALAGLDRTELLIRAADARRRSDAPQRAAELLQAAADGVDEREQPLLAARVLEKLADRRWELGEVAAADAAVARAHALLDPRPEPLTQRSTLLATEAQELERAGRWAEAMPVARAAIEAAARARDPDSALRAYRSLGFALAGTGHGEAGVEAVRAGIAVARDADLTGIDDRRADVLPVTLTFAHMAVALVTSLAGRVGEALELAADTRRRELAIGHESYVLGRVTMRLALLAGDVHAARVTLPPPAQSSMGLAYLEDQLCRAELALVAGDDAAARTHVERAEPLVGVPHRPPFIGRVAIARATLESRAGDAGAARRAVDAALAVLDGGSREPIFSAELAAAGARVEDDAASPDPDRVAAFLARAAAIAGRPADAAGRGAGAPGGPPDASGGESDAARHAPAGGPVEAAHARLCAAVLAGEDGRWDDVAAAYEGVGWGAAALDARLRGARVRLAAGDRAAAAQAASAVRDVARRHGLAALERDAAGLLDRAGAGDAQGEGAYGLTARERQVLALLAAGRRNREIGAELFMAEKTASVHVSRILAKLGVRSRTEAAALALAEGLVDG